MAAARRERIGIFGGTFDPIHVAHLALGVAAKHQLELDRVLFVVANVPWQKAALRHVSDAEDRFAMVAAAVAGHDGLEASRLELDRGGESYTADTLAELSAPDRDLYLIIGSDLLGELTTWKRTDELARRCTLAVAHRPGGESSGPIAPGWRIATVRLPALELSSTELRQMAGGGRPIDFLVPDSALRIIRERGLYRDSGFDAHTP